VIDGLFENSAGMIHSLVIAAVNFRAAKASALRIYTLLNRISAKRSGASSMTS
jgi:hypothetical protein